MKKYPIDRQFFPFDRFTPPISRDFLRFAVPHMKAPRLLWHDPALKVDTYTVNSRDGAPFTCLLLSPTALTGRTPCLVYIHGGGFVLPAAGYHYQNAMRYAKEAGCRVLFVQYRLAPDHPFPTFFEDVYAAFTWACAHAEQLGIDTARIAVGGDSAGADLAVGLCLMLRERLHPVRPICQLLAYPYLDARGNSESCRKYTDTPMWNASLSQRIGPMTKVDPKDPAYIWYSPVEAPSLTDMPPAYVETAEFDCLHDDGILYARRLREAGVPVVLNETRGTMHGFDIMTKAPITRAAVAARIDYLKQRFAEERT